MILRTRQINNNINHQLRKEIAMALRLMHRSLYKRGKSQPASEPELPADDMASEIAWMKSQYENSWEYRAWRMACEIVHDFLFILFCVGLVWFFCYVFIGKAGAQEIPGYSDIQIVNAIYLAEGGVHAQYPFGIRSTSCAGYTSCRQICLTTIKHNRRRFAEYGFKTNPDFISFLGNRYCPIRGRLSKAEKRVNKNWQRNVRYFLGKDRQ